MKEAFISVVMLATVAAVLLAIVYVEGTYCAPGRSFVCDVTHSFVQFVAPRVF